MRTELTLALHEGGAARRMEAAVSRSMLIVTLRQVALSRGGVLVASPEAIHDALCGAARGDSRADEWLPSCGQHLAHLLRDFTADDHRAAQGRGLHITAAARGTWSLRALPDPATRKAA